MAINYRRKIRKLFLQFGIDIRRVRSGREATARLPTLLAHNQIDLVLDVGANIGQYGQYLFDTGFTGRVVSFEPLPDAHMQLEQLAKSQPRWIVSPVGSLGDKDGTAILNVSKNSESSSLLQHYGRAQLDPLPSAAFEDTIPVTMNRLDTVAPQYMVGHRYPFLKLDVQGFEHRVLVGGVETIPKLRGLQLETSLVQLYEGESLYPEMVELILSYGFELHGLIPGYWDRLTGRLLQVDCVFIR